MSQSYERFAGILALLSVLGSIGYSAVFFRQAIFGHDLFLGGLFLMLGGVLSVVVMLAIYLRVREAKPAFAALGMLFVALGAYGSMTHGGYFLALASGAIPNGLLTPSETDPVGQMTFGVAGLGYFFLAWAMVRSQTFPRLLGLVGGALGVTSMALYLVRLIKSEASTALLGFPAIEAAGLLIAAAWFVWLGVILLRPQKAS